MKVLPPNDDDVSLPFAVVHCDWVVLMWTDGWAQLVEATPYSNPLPNPLLTNESGAVGNSFFIGEVTN